MKGINSSDLDRHITGNFGEDQFLGKCGNPHCGFLGYIYDECMFCLEAHCPECLEEHQSECVKNPANQNSEE